MSVPARSQRRALLLLLLATIAAGSYTYANTGLSGTLTYTYRIRAANATGYSAYAGPISQTPLPSPPAAPTGLTVSAASATSLLLTWHDNSTNETGFRVQIQDPDTSFRTLLTVGAGVTSYTHSGLSPNTSYTYRVRATNDGGDSAPAEANSTGWVDLTAQPGQLYVYRVRTQGATNASLSVGDVQVTLPRTRRKRG